MIKYDRLGETMKQKGFTISANHNSIAYRILKVLALLKILLHITKTDLTNNLSIVC